LSEQTDARLGIGRHMHPGIEGALRTGAVNDSIGDKDMIDGEGGYDKNNRNNGNNILLTLMKNLTTTYRRMSWPVGNNRKRNQRVQFA